MKSVYSDSERGAASIEAALKLLLIVAVVTVPMASMSGKLNLPLSAAADAAGGGTAGTLLDNEGQGPAAPPCPAGVPCVQPPPSPTVIAGPPEPAE